MLPPNDTRRARAADYLRGRTLKEALAAWRTDYEAPTYRERRPMLARLGNVIRKLAEEAEAQDEAAADHPGQRPKRKKRAPRP